MSTVWFMVDDTDPRLNYSGNWTLVPSVTTNEDSFDGSPTGSVYNSTLHSPMGNVTATFRFNGTLLSHIYLVFSDQCCCGIVVLYMDSSQDHPISEYMEQSVMMQTIPSSIALLMVSRYGTLA